MEAIIKEYKADLEKTRIETEQLKEVLFDKQRRETRFEYVAIGEKQDLIPKERARGRKMSSKNGLIQKMENQILQKRSRLVREKQEFDRIFDIFQNICMTVSRIMYQLQPREKDRAVEVNKTNVRDYFSHIGLKLEKMLSFVKMRDKSIQNEEILIANVINRSDKPDK